MTALHELSIAEAGSRIAAGELAPVDLTRAFLERIDRHDENVHSYVLICGDQAVAEAERAGVEIRKGRYRGPLHGIPVALKDIVNTKGIRTTYGSRQYEHHVPDRDAHPWARLKDAGAILLGKLSNHEFANAGPSLDGLFPPPLNPWNHDRYPGGSSSGSGAAVAAGLCMMAVGTDTGGSIRVPAAFCGIAGLKPTYGLVSRHGVFAVSNSMDHCGPITWTAADCALALSVMAGHDPEDPSSANLPTVDYASALGERLDGLRVGCVRHFSREDYAVDEEVNDAVDVALSVMAELGATVTDVALPSLSDFHAATLPIMVAEAYAVHEAELKWRPQDFTELARARARLGAFVGAADYVQAQRVRRTLAERYRQVLREVDVVVCPTMSSTAITAAAAQSVQKFVILDNPVLTMPFNCVGAPAISICCGYCADGSPSACRSAAGPMTMRPCCAPLAPMNAPRPGGNGVPFPNKPEYPSPGWAATGRAAGRP